MGAKSMTRSARYKIQQRLGKKAGRQTFLARDRDTQELVVVKLLTFSSDFNWDDLKLFEREVETLQALSHPAIPRYLDSFEVETSNGKGFALVQSYIEAKSLEEHLKNGRNFSESEVRQIAKAILEILAYLHAQKPPVIHRDIKPSNILLACGTGKMPIPQDPDQVGGTGKMPIAQDKLISCLVGVSPAQFIDTRSKLYLVDFGSVQTLATKEGKTVTVVGTYGYMPPEQFGGIATPASDLYSVGATLIALLTKKHPADLPQKDLRIQFEQFTSVSPEFTRWLKRMIEPSVERRFKSAKEALQALEKTALTQNNSLAVRQRNYLKTLELFGNAIWQNTWKGTVFGTVCGTLYGTAIFPIIGTIFGAFYGAVVGLPVGFLNGFLVAIVTRLWFLPLKNTKLHRRTVVFISTLIGTVSALVGFSSLEGTEGLLNFYLSTIAPSAIVGLLMGASSKATARWYEQQTKIEDDNNDG